MEFDSLVLAPDALAPAPWACHPFSAARFATIIATIVALTVIVGSSA
jgi:hypothetical protein